MPINQLTVCLCVGRLQAWEACSYLAHLDWRGLSHLSRAGKAGQNHPVSNRTSTRVQESSTQGSQPRISPEPLTSLPADASFAKYPELEAKRGSRHIR